MVVTHSGKPDWETHKVQKQLTKLFVNIGIVAIILNAPVVGEDERSVEGKWLGSLKAGVELRIGIVVERDGDDYRVYMISFDQVPSPTPAENATFNGTTLKFGFPALKASFSGTISADGQLIKGVFIQGLPLPLNLSRVDDFPQPNRPQTPKPPFPYMAEEVTYENHETGNVIAGTLTTPNASGPFPVALLISGSGAQDRDETIMGHKPFAVIADYFTRKGIAVLRVDDPGVGESGGSMRDATTQDFVIDVQSGVQFLRNHPKIDGDQVFLVGHSEGGLIAPIIPSSDRRLAGIVLVAGPGVRGRELLVLQNRLIMRATGETQKVCDWFSDFFDAQIGLILSTPNDETLEDRSLALYDEHLELAPEIVTDEAGQLLRESVRNNTIPSLNNPWMRYFLEFDPEKTLRKVKCPTFAFFGDLDLQVPPSQSMKPLRDALMRGKCKDFLVKSYPELNHLMQHCKTGSVTEYSQIEETFSEEVLEDMAGFILDRLK